MGDLLLEEKDIVNMLSNIHKCDCIIPTDQENSNGTNKQIYGLKEEYPELILNYEYEIIDL